MVVAKNVSAVRYGCGAAAYVHTSVPCEGKLVARGWLSSAPGRGGGSNGGLKNRSSWYTRTRTRRRRHLSSDRALVADAVAAAVRGWLTRSRAAVRIL